MKDMNQVTVRRDLTRLFRPKSIALFGGGWVGNVIAQLQKSGYAGAIWPVNPKRADILGVPCFASIDDLPGAPDAAFVGVNREASIDVVARLSAMGSGGATCFASGFAESEAEGTGGADLQAELVAAAGDMPIVGPNCYGFLNYLDNVTFWPDQHGGLTVESGIAIVGQSSNMAINMTMQARGLPIAYVLTAGNQAQTSLSELGMMALDDPRVTALGLHIEGFGDIRAFEALAALARAKGKPVVVLKSGHSEAAQAATMTHTASLAGGAAASSALIARLGMVEVRSLTTFLEALKLLHFGGPLRDAGIGSVSCSGGEASLMADCALGTAIEWPAFSSKGKARLNAILGPIVTVANPLDYHTFIWGDTERMTDCFAAVLDEQRALCVFVLDLPRPDRCSQAGYRCAVDAIIGAARRTGARAAVLVSMPENLTEDLAAEFSAAGVVPLFGMVEGLEAIDVAIRAGRLAARPAAAPVLLRGAPEGGVVLSEAEAKAALAAHGLDVPQSVTAASAEALAVAAGRLRMPLAVKGQGIAHKTEAGAVKLHIRSPDEAAAAAHAMAGATGFLAEEMVTGAVAELLVGITRDPTGLMMLTLGAGGVMAEMLADTASILLPATNDDIRAALGRLKIAKLLAGWRGAKAADMGAIVRAVQAIAAYAAAEPGLQELDVNPLIATPERAVAVDALIRKA
ncbi:acetate--CoA ligase family protein [Frigidibacter sp. RF13]|uniref:acetate--CoA ligase family protein n=1 Tax=Frigidibacter sp. RF13 TaxID=2997340 RepID=UPI00226D64B6|nr:acetate--CoA ligase family protein [Frigidibacter sp. RF13]MCY1125594.1 acetate--CoA ligase family protein [Frigidibacter sp. RF13]